MVRESLCLSRIPSVRKESAISSSGGGHGRVLGDECEVDMQGHGVRPEMAGRTGKLIRQKEARKMSWDRRKLGQREYPKDVNPRLFVGF